MRDKETKRCLVWDVSEGRAVPHDSKNIPSYEAARTIDYALEGEYEVSGIQCRPAFQLIKDHLKQYTPEMASEISTVPAEKIRKITREFAQEARIGSTVILDGHETSFQTCFAVSLLNSLVGGADVYG